MLMIVKASEVREGEPRLWMMDRSEADRVFALGAVTKSSLHLRPSTIDDATHAIVDRAAPSGIESGIAMEMNGVPRAVAGDLHALVELLKERGPATEEVVVTEEKVWRQAFNAALPAMLEALMPAKAVEAAEQVADLVLEAWKKRWQR